MFCTERNHNSVPENTVILNSCLLKIIPSHGGFCVFWLWFFSSLHWLPLAVTSRGCTTMSPGESPKAARCREMESCCHGAKGGVMLPRHSVPGVPSHSASPYCGQIPINAKPANLRVTSKPEWGTYCQPLKSLDFQHHSVTWASRILCLLAAYKPYATKVTQFQDHSYIY